MGFLIRAAGTEHALTNEPLTVGCAQSAALRVEGAGVEAVHLRIDATRMEALADCIVGGVPLKAGASRAVVPCAIAIGSATLAVEATEDSEELSTRELALGAIAGPGKLWSYAVIVEGRSVGNMLVLREDRAYRVGRTSASDLVVEDPEASRDHLEIIRLGDEILVRDLGSTGGSWLGRTQLEGGRKAEWAASRMLRIGATVIALVRPPRIVERAVEAPEPVPRPADTVSDEPVVVSDRVAAPISIAVPVEPAPFPPRVATSRPLPRGALALALFLLVGAGLAGLVWLVLAGE